MTRNCLHGYKTRTVKCTNCNQEFDQIKLSEDGCFSVAWWSPGDCPNCGAYKKFEVPFLLSIFPSDLKIILE